MTNLNCFTCGKETVCVCSKCSMVSFCDYHCELKGSKQHQIYCDLNRPLSTFFEVNAVYHNDEIHILTILQRKKQMKIHPICKLLVEHTDYFKKRFKEVLNERKQIYDTKGLFYVQILHLKSYDPSFFEMKSLKRMREEEYFDFGKIEVDNFNEFLCYSTTNQLCVLLETANENSNSVSISFVRLNIK